MANIVSGLHSNELVENKVTTVEQQVNSLDTKYAKLEHTHDELVSTHKNAKLILFCSTTTPTRDFSVYFKNLLKQICTDYPNEQDSIFICVAMPSVRGMCFVNIYDTNVVNADGLPQHSTGMFYPLSTTNEIYRFGTYDYVYSFTKI